MRREQSARAPDDLRARERLRDLVNNHFEAVGRALRRFGVRPADVDDLTQRVFLTATRRLGDIRHGSEGAFLAAVALREAAHQRRDYRRRAETSDDAIADKSTGKPRPDELAYRAEVQGLLEQSITQLDDGLRLVVELFQVDELSIKEISEALELPIGTVKSRLRRARERLSLDAERLRSSPER